MIPQRLWPYYNGVYYGPYGVNHGYHVFLADALRLPYDGPACDFVFTRDRGMMRLSFRCSCQDKRLKRNAIHKQTDESNRLRAFETHRVIRKLAYHIIANHSQCPS